MSARIGFTPELARAVIETQGSKATPVGTLLREFKNFRIMEIMRENGIFLPAFAYLGTELGDFFLRGRKKNRESG